MKRLLLILSLVCVIGWAGTAKAQTNTFCAANLTCPVTANWSFSSLNTILTVDGTKYTTIDSAIAAVPSFTIANAPTGATESGNVATITTTAPHGYAANQVVFVQGVGVSAYNGQWPIISVTSTSFTYRVCQAPTTQVNCTTGLGTSGGGTTAPAAHIVIPASYFGAESTTCSSLDSAGNNIGYTFAITPANIHIEDRRGTSNCAYNTSWNANQLQSNPNDLTLFRRDVSPNITSSNLTTDMQITGTIPSAQGIAGGTFEVDTVGNVSISGAPIIQASNGQWAVRSNGGTITQIMGAAGGGGIDRSYATTNVTQASGLYAFDPKNSSSSGATIAESYGLIASLPTTGTRNNDAIFSQGPIVFSDNVGGIDVMNQSYSLPTGATAQRLLRFGGDNNQTNSGVNLYNLYSQGTLLHWIQTSGTHFNWLQATQANLSECMEFTPSTATGGTTFTTPLFQICNSPIALKAAAPLSPTVAGAQDLGTTALPWGNLWLGTAATNNFKFQPASTTGARVITITDPVNPTTVALPLTIASSTATMVSGSIAAATCATAVTVAATGVATTDSIEWAYATAPTLTTDALLHISPYVTSGNVNFIRCNPTAGAIVGTAIVINWRVIR